MEKREPSNTIGGNVNWCSHCGKQQKFLKMKTRTTMWFNNSTPGYISKKPKALIWNLENSAVATGLEKVSFHSNPKERQCQRMLKLPRNCTYLTTEWLHFHFSLSCIGEGNGNPLQCSCLENPWDGGAWWAAIYGVAQSRTRLKQLSSSSNSS